MPRKPPAPKPPKNKGRRLPRRYKNKDGKETGNYFGRDDDGRDVNLRTKNAGRALKRAAELYKGIRSWPQDDTDPASEAVAATVVGTGANQAPVVEPPAPAASGLRHDAPPPVAPGLHPSHTAPAALPPPTPHPSPENAASASSARPSVHPDGYMPPHAGWAAAMGEAAGQGPGPEGGGDDEIPEEFLEQILGSLADLAVEGQLMLQAWLIKRRAQLQASPVPPEAKAREVGRALWMKVIRELFPSDLPIPAWLAAPVMVAALSLPVQFSGAQPVKEETAPSSPESSQAAA